MNKNKIAIAALVPVALFALAGCAHSSTATSADASVPSGMVGVSGSPALADTKMYNDADSAFAAAMIPHHEQAVEMAKLASARASDPRVKDLAARIEAAQEPEIAMMSGWLTAWGASGHGSDHGMDHGGMMDGMMSEADMTNLAAGNGPDFDKAFLAMMIAHHEGALTMAEAAVKSGSNSDAKSLAQSIIDGQAKEIAEMKAILGNE